MPTLLTERMTELAAGRVPFVHAVVVRAQEPTPARPGDDAIILADGSIEGFVGGQCAEASVRAAALGALADGETVLLRVLPGDATAFPESPGARVVTNPCLSGGALEIFLEPLLPPAMLHVVGASPVAEAVVAAARALGWAVSRALGAPGVGGPGVGDRPDGAVAVVVASHGRDDEAGHLRAALDAGVGLVGLVASRRRGEAVLAGLDLSEGELRRVRTPVGLDIGAATAPEIAVSVVAEIVRAVRLDNLTAPSTVPRGGSTTLPELTGLPDLPVLSARTELPVVEPPVPGRAGQAIDPVCGMTVVVRSSTPHLVVDGHDVWFCCPGCRDSHAAATGHQTAAGPRAGR